MGDIDVRITVRSKPCKGKSTLISLIEGMLRDYGFKNVTIDDRDLSRIERERIRQEMTCGERDNFLKLHVAVDQEQTPRSQDT